MRSTESSRLRRWVWSCAGVLLLEGVATLALQSPALPRVVTVDAPPFALGASDPTELSGLTWVGGDRYLAVSDGNDALYRYTITIDRSDGRILAVSGSAPVPLVDADGRSIPGQDLEGVAYDPSTGEVLVVDERRRAGPDERIRRHDLDSGRLLATITVPPVFAGGRFRDGYGLESLALNGRHLWTTNEEALSGDGPRATREAGTLVRLTRFDEGVPAGQWAYETGPTGGTLPYGGLTMGGVVDLAVLPDGRLLVLERATTGGRSLLDIGGFLSRLVLADTAQATDVSSRERLDDAVAGVDYEPAARTELWRQSFPVLVGLQNYEGLALGPTLDDGSRSLILVADNDALPSTLLALRLEAEATSASGRSARAFVPPRTVP